MRDAINTFDNCDVDKHSFCRQTSYCWSELQDFKLCGGLCYLLLLITIPISLF